MLNSLNLLIYHVICGLIRRTGTNFVASVSWSSALLMSVSLQQNFIGATINVRNLFTSYARWNLSQEARGRTSHNFCVRCL